MGDTAPNPFGYCGEYLDNETGLIYLRNRYYNSATGRFLTEDPAKDGANWYVYANNNPVMFVDPNGDIYLIAWSYSKADLVGYKDSNGNVNWNKFTKENSFARAAYTRKQELIDSGVSKKDIDVQRIDNEQDLKNTWNMWAGYEEVEGLDVYSHGTPDGYPEMAYGGGGYFLERDAAKLDWTTTIRKMDGKAVIQKPYAVFHGCNTAKGMFAQNFANFQRVDTYAQLGGASFSQNPLVHIPINRFSKKVYLQHFEKNNMYNSYGWGYGFWPQ